MRPGGFWSVVLVTAAWMAGSAASAQSIVSVRSGAIHYTEGSVFLDDRAVKTKFGEFVHIDENSVLRTGRGRAEVLLTPGVFLRMSENSAVRMVSSSLEDTRMQMLEGSVLVECAELLKDNSVVFYQRQAAIALREEGLYRFDSVPAQLRVYDGKADVWAGSEHVEVKKGKVLSFDGDLAVAKFDTKQGDPFYRWSARRASYVALANISAAKSLRDSGSGWRIGGWGWNPYFGMITFIPSGSVRYSPFGYTFWSPRHVQQVFQPARRVMTGWGGDSGGRYNANLGYSTVPRTASGGYSAPPASTGPSGAPAPAASPRTGESSSPRSGGGGRGR